MPKVRCKKIPLWNIIKKVVTPRIKAPYFPVSSIDGDPFYLSEQDNTEFVNDATWNEVLKSVIPYLKYAWATGQLQTVLKFMIVGASGLILNILIVNSLVAVGIDAKISGIIGTILTIFTNFLINDCWTFKKHRNKRPWLHRLIGYYGTSLGTMILQIIVYEVMIIVGLSPTVSVLISVAISYVFRLVYIRDKVYKFTE